MNEADFLGNQNVLDLMKSYNAERRLRKIMLVVRIAMKWKKVGEIGRLNRELDPSPSIAKHMLELPAGMIKSTSFLLHASAPNKPVVNNVILASTSDLKGELGSKKTSSKLMPPSLNPKNIASSHATLKPASSVSSTSAGGSNGAVQSIPTNAAALSPVNPVLGGSKNFLDGKLQTVTMPRLKGAGSVHPMASLKSKTNEAEKQLSAAPNKSERKPLPSGAPAGSSKMDISPTSTTLPRRLSGTSKQDVAGSVLPPKKPATKAATSTIKPK